MKPLAIAVASLLLLSALWVGTDTSPAPVAYSHAEGNNTRTPGAKSTKKAATKTPRATPKAKGKKVNYSGVVVAVGGGSLTIKTESGEGISFLVTEETAIKIPSLGKDATLGNISIGVRALVRAREEEGSYTAIQISVVPGKPPVKHHVGVVVAYEPAASITILAHDGEEYTFIVTEDTKLLPEEHADELAVGRTVTIISRRDPTGSPFTSQGIVIHPITENSTGTPEETSTPTFTATETPTETSPLEQSPTGTFTPTDIPS